MTRFGMVIDLNRCTGCRACMEACKVENSSPEGALWMYVFRFEQGTYPNLKIRFLPRPCMHCENPPCARACPSGARYLREDGLVATDYERCIGARYCMAACPYGVNYFNWKSPEENFYLNWGMEALKPVTRGMSPPYKNPELDLPYGKEKRHIAGGGHKKGVVEKCTFCVHRIEKGLLPSCADVCPVKAINFGDLDDPQSGVSRLIREGNPRRHLEEFGTSPKVYYIGGELPGSGFRQIELAGKGIVK